MRHSRWRGAGPSIGGTGRAYVCTLQQRHAAELNRGVVAVRCKQKVTRRQISHWMDACSGSTLGHMAGKIDWTRLTDSECFESLKAAPKVFGPWTRAGDDGEAYVRPAADGSPSLVIVKRLMGTWHGYAGKSISLPPSFASHEPAMELVDSLLRSQGARLVGPSRPLRTAPRPTLAHPTHAHQGRERPTSPAAPHAMSPLSAVSSAAERSR